MADRTVKVTLSADISRFASALAQAEAAAKKLADGLDRAGDKPLNVDTSKAVSALDKATDAAGKVEDAVDEVDGSKVGVDTGKAVSSLGKATDAAEDAEDAIDQVDGSKVNVDTAKAQASLDKTADAAESLGDEVDQVDGTRVAIDTAKAQASLDAAADAADDLDSAVDAVNGSKVDIDTAKATASLGKTADGAAKTKIAFADLSAQAGISVGKVGEAAVKVRGLGAEWEKVQNTAVHAGAAWDTVGSTLGKVGVVAAAGAGLAVREFATFDQAMSGVASTGADAAAQITSLRDAAIEAGAETAYSATEAANAIEELARAGVSTADILGGGLTGALDLAAAGQLSVANASGIASTAMTQFKLSGKDVGHIADLLAAGAGKAMGGVDDLGMALKQGGLVASQFGLSIEETVGGLSAFAAAGLIGSDAGTSLKAMLIALANPAGKTKKTMDELGISAYDASGKFIGLEGLAGQLQDRLGGLSEETRNQALAQIFGNDAIRAASILYENGSEGIAQWTAAVDDAGYATRTANELQNNLIGDLEKLGGSWSAVAVQMGSTADGPLRLLVQGLTSLLDLAGQFPGVTSSLIVLGGTVAGLGLGAFTLMKGVKAVAEYRTALAELSDMNPRLGKLAGGLGTLAKAAGGAAVAMVGIGAAKAAFDWFDGVPADADRVTAALERAARGTGNLDTAFQTIDGSPLVYGVDSITSAMERYANRGLLYMDQLDEFGSSILGYSSDLDKLRQQFGLLDQQIASMDTANATAQFRAIAEEGAKAGLSVDDLVTLFPQYSAKMDQLAAANGLGALSTAELAALMSGEMVRGLQLSADGTQLLTREQIAAGAAAYDAADGQNALASSADQAASAQEGFADAVQEAADAAQAERDALTALNDSMLDNANAALTASGAQNKLEDAIDKASEAASKNGQSLDRSTEAGRANWDALDGLAGAALNARSAMLANGDSIDTVNGKTQRARDEFVRVATQMGMTAGEANQLADSYGLIPNAVNTLVAAPGATLSKQQADNLNAALKGLPDSVKSTILTEANRSGYDSAMALLRAADGKTATTYIKTVRTTEDIRVQTTIKRQGQAAVATGGYGADVARAFYGFSDGGSPLSRRHYLGLIHGPGTPTSDSIPAWLSTREFVQNADSTAYYGPDLMYALNRKEIPREAFAPYGFADGGTPGGPRASDFATRQYATPLPPQPTAPAPIENHFHAPLLVVEKAEVRNDQDIPKLSQQFQQRIDARARANGVDLGIGG